MDMSGAPLYAFGHGLSYTDFEYSDLKISAPDMNSNPIVTVSCRVKNTGNREGAEVVQLYLRDVLASVSQPPMLLKGFRRIELKPGESAEVSFPLSRDELSIYNQALEQVVEPGEFKVMVGSSSADIRLKGAFTL